MTDKVKQLIAILLDKNNREDERDDAAIDLRGYLSQNALEALVNVASDPNEDDVLINNCAESIAEICIGLNTFHKKIFNKLVPFAQKIVYEYIMAHNPNLIFEKNK